MIARAVLTATALSTSAISTGLVGWAGSSYVVAMRPLGKLSAKGDPEQLEIHTLTLTLARRITRVYDTNFLVETRRPFSKWELAPHVAFFPSTTSASASQQPSSDAPSASEVSGLSGVTSVLAAEAVVTSESPSEGRAGAPGTQETIAETMDSKGEVLGRWIVTWGENGAGECTSTGSVIRYFNVHPELLE